MALYIAALGIRTQLKAAGVRGDVLFWVFLAATPALLLLVTFGNAKKTSGRLPLKWPIWKMIASAIAFAAWGCAIPGNPWVTTPNGGAVAGFVAMVTSVILGVIGNLFDPS